MTIKIGSVYNVTFKSGNTHTAFSWPSKIPDSGNNYMKNKVIKITKKLNTKDSLDYDYVGDIYDKIDGAIELKNIKIVSNQLILKSSPFKIAGKRKKSKKKTKKKKTKRGTYKKKTHKKRTRRKTYKKMKGGSGGRRRGLTAEEVIEAAKSKYELGGEKQIRLVDGEIKDGLIKRILQETNPKDRIKTLQMLAENPKPRSLPSWTPRTMDAARASEGVLPDAHTRRLELEALSGEQLNGRALKAGATGAELDQTAESENAKAALVELVLRLEAEAYARARRNVASVRHQWMDEWMKVPRVTQAQSTQPFPPPEKIETATMPPPDLIADWLNRNWKYKAPSGRAIVAAEALKKKAQAQKAQAQKAQAQKEQASIVIQAAVRGHQTRRPQQGEAGRQKAAESETELDTEPEPEPDTEPEPEPDTEPEPKPNPILEYKFLKKRKYEKFYATLKRCELSGDHNSIVVELILEEPIPPERTDGTKFYGVSNITITLNCSNPEQFKQNIEDLLGWLLPEFAQFGRIRPWRQKTFTPRKRGKTYYEIEVTEVTEDEQQVRSIGDQKWATISYPRGWLTWTSEGEKDGQLLFDALTAYTAWTILANPGKSFTQLIDPIGSEWGGDEIWGKAFADLLPGQQDEARAWLDKHKDSIKRHMLNFELFGISQLSLDVSPGLLPRVALYLTSCIMGSFVFYMDETNTLISRKKENDEHLFKFQKLLMNKLIRCANKGSSRPTSSFEISVVSKKVNLDEKIQIYNAQQERERTMTAARKLEEDRLRVEAMRKPEGRGPGFYIIKSNSLPCDISYHKPLDSEGGGPIAYLALGEIVMVTEVKRYQIPHPNSRLPEGTTFELMRLKCDKGWFDGNEYLLYPDGKENVTVLKITNENFSCLKGSYRVKNTVTVRKNSDSSSEDNGVLNPGVEVDVTDVYLDEEKISLMFKGGWFDLIRKEPRCFTPEEEKDLKEYLSKIKIEELRGLLKIQDIDELRRVLRDKLKLIKEEKKQGKKDSALHTVQNAREASLLIKRAMGKTESVAIKIA